MKPPPLPWTFERRGDSFVDLWQGAPFQWDGRTLAGVDCWGLVVMFHAMVKGQHLPDWARRGEARAWVRRMIADKQKDHWAALAQPVDGCIAKAPSHVGICWRGGVLHADETRGVIFERLADFIQANPALEFGEFRQ